MTAMGTQRDSETAVLAIRGHFDTQLTPDVQREFDALLTAGVRFIILDVTHVDFIDSSALAVMVRGMKRCRERNGELLLCGLAEPVRTIFELTRMDRAFRIYEDEAAARAALAGR